jgi:exodeoxyribonuclease VII small subunit
MSEITKAPAFEETLAQLEALVSRMEDGRLSLEEALSAFESGIKLTRECQQSLQQAELKVQMLTRADGEPTTFPGSDARNGAAANTPDTPGVCAD